MRIQGGRRGGTTYGGYISVQITRIPARKGIEETKKEKEGSKVSNACCFIGDVTGH
jgi:hypothetical protein